MLPLHREFVQFMEHHATREMTNPHHYQNWNASVFGHVCVYYLLKRYEKEKGSRMAVTLSRDQSYSSRSLQGSLV